MTDIVSFVNHGEDKECECRTCEEWRKSKLKVFRINYSTDNDILDMYYLGLDKTNEDFDKAVEKAIQESVFRGREHTSDECFELLKDAIRDEGFVYIHDYVEHSVMIDEKPPTKTGYTLKKPPYSPP
jgi:hypothetical protein